MATTTNYSWTTPDDTSLVKDGASAIRTLGSSVDTTTKNLNPETTLGDISFRSSTSNVNTRLGIGGTGTVLTVAAGVPSWATPSSGSMTLISTTTLTGASVTLSSIPQTHNKLFLVIQNFKPATDGVFLRMRYNGDTGANRHTGSVYYDQFYYNTAFSFSTTSSVISAINDDTVSTSLITVDIPDYTNTTTWKMGETTALNVDDITTTQWQFYKGIALYNQTTAISSLQFLPGGGNFTSGTVLLYGVK